MPFLATILLKVKGQERRGGRGRVTVTVISSSGKWAGQGLVSRSASIGVGLSEGCKAKGKDSQDRQRGVEWMIRRINAGNRATSLFFSRTLSPSLTSFPHHRTFLLPVSSSSLSFSHQLFLLQALFLAWRRGRCRWAWQTPARWLSAGPATPPGPWRSSWWPGTSLLAHQQVGDVHFRASRGLTCADSNLLSFLSPPLPGMQPGTEASQGFPLTASPSGSNAAGTIVPIIVNTARKWTQKNVSLCWEHKEHADLWAGWLTSKWDDFPSGSGLQEGRVRGTRTAVYSSTNMPNASTSPNQNQPARQKEEDQIGHQGASFKVKVSKDLFCPELALFIRREASRTWLTLKTPWIPFAFVKWFPRETETLSSIYYAQLSNFILIEDEILQLNSQLQNYQNSSETEPTSCLNISGRNKNKKGNLIIWLKC